MSREPPVCFEGVSKCYMWRRERPRSFLDTFTALVRKREPAREFWALQGLSFVLAPGQALGLIGPNGAGKSTALKIASGVVRPSQGTVHVSGRLSALLELAAGFHPDLTGGENIYLSGALMGLSKREMQQRYSAIVEFAGIGDFIDSPVRHYSSGMSMRLGFAVASSVDPAVLLVDEVLAVGDRAFSRRCLDRIYSLKERGTAIIFVSHDLESVRALCERAALLEQGQPVFIGPTDEAIGRYLHGVAETSSGRDSEREDRWGSGEARLEDVWLEDETGQRVNGLVAGAGFSLCMRYNSSLPVQGLTFGLSIKDEAGYLLTGPNTCLGDLQIPEMAESGVVRYRVQASPLQPGRYFIAVSVYDRTLRHAYDHWEYCLGFDILPGGTRSCFGVMSLAGKWEWGAGAPGAVQVGL